MQALMLLFDSDLSPEIFMLMKLTEISNYTHFKGLHGSGNQGKKEGSITWPGNNELMMLLLNEQEIVRLKSAIQEFKKNKNGPTGLLLFYWPLSEVII